MKIAIAIPNADNFKSEMVATAMTMAYYQGIAGRELVIINAESPCIDENRNMAIEKSKEQNVDYLLMIDSDMEALSSIDPDIIGRMIAMGKDVVSGVAYQGLYPFRPAIYDWLYNMPDKSVIRSWFAIPDVPFKIDSAGGALVLISKRVIQAFTPEVIDRIGRPFDLIFEGRRLMYREDVAFYWRMKELGFEVWACPSIPLGHMKKWKVTEEHFRIAKTQIIGKERSNGECQMRFSPLVP